MARKKRTSKVLVNAESRNAGLRSIHDNLDLGNGLTLSEYTRLIDDMRTKLSEYNAALSRVDKACNAVHECERVWRDYSEVMLMGVATKYGKDSNEYEMAGGVRKSERKRPARRTSKAA